MVSSSRIEIDILNGVSPIANILKLDLFKVYHICKAQIPTFDIFLILGVICDNF